MQRKRTRWCDSYTHSICMGTRCAWTSIRPFSFHRKMSSVTVSYFLWIRSRRNTAAYIVFAEWASKYLSYPCVQVDGGCSVCVCVRVCRLTALFFTGNLFQRFRKGARVRRIINAHAGHAAHHMSGKRENSRVLKKQFERFAPIQPFQFRLLRHFMLAEQQALEAVHSGSMCAYAYEGGGNWSTYGNLLKLLRN